MHTFRASVACARDELRGGAGDSVALRRAKETAPFSDPQTRARLIGWLDDLGIARWLDLSSCSELYERRGLKLVHWTSLIRYPAFRWSRSKQRWVNYGGQPDPWRHFDDIIEGAFVPELKRIKATIVFTLGDKTRDTCRWLATRGTIEGSLLVALPHPSGQNVGNEEEFARRRRDLRRDVRRLLPC
jgi:hypothetical protein